MSEQSIYADGTYLAANPNWHAEDAPWKARQILRMLNKHLVRPTTVGEIGCGTGLILHELAKAHGPEVSFFGFEISRDALEMCRSREAPNVRFYPQEKIEDFDLPFDVLLMIDVIEHVDDCYAMLRAARKKGKLKIFHIPLDLSAQSVLREKPLTKWRREVGHVHFFTKSTALMSLKETGYEVIDHFYTKTDIELGNRGWKANIMKVPRRFLFSLHEDFAVRLMGGFSLMVLAR